MPAPKVKSLKHLNRENLSPTTPLLRKSRPLPGPSPLSLKRSASFGSSSSSDRPRKRRTRSSDVIFQRRVSTLLEQAQSMYKDGERVGDNSSGNTFPESEDVETKDELVEEFAFDGDLDLLEEELQFDPLSSDGLPQRDIKHQQTHPTINSDDLFDTTFDEFNSEDLEELDKSSNELPQQQQQQEESKEVKNDDDVLFGDGYDELMDIDFSDDTQSEVEKL